MYKRITASETLELPGRGKKNIQPTDSKLSGNDSMGIFGVLPSPSSQVNGIRFVHPVHSEHWLHGVCSPNAVLELGLILLIS
jgi:hypothetical protein